MVDDRKESDTPANIRKMRSLYNKTVLWLGGFFLVFWVGISTSLYINERSRLKENAEKTCEVVLTQIDAAQVYVREQLRPVMFGLVGDGEFYPEAMSSTFVSRGIFERFQQHYPDYYFKFASLNPRNPRNMASDIERQIIQHFRESPNLDEWRGVIVYKDEPFECVATPIEFDDTCMICHGNPSDAPAGLVVQYGDEAAFNLKSGDIAIKSVGIPIGSALAQSRANAALYAILAGIFFFGLFWLASRLIENLINKPLAILREGAERFGDGDLDFRLSIKSGDEFEQLADSFNSMAERINVSHDNLRELVAERTRELNERLAELEVFNNTMVGREQRMIELKQEINELYVQLGKAPKFGMNQSECGSEADID
jgi:two-component system NtrC family sensor kinase